MNKYVIVCGVISAVVLLQPELRTAFDSMRKCFPSRSEYQANRTLVELSSALFEMSREQVGALIVVERGDRLDEYAATGVLLDAVVSHPLLTTIFAKNTRLHDGAVLVRGDRVTSASVLLPLSTSSLIPQHYGTRHRAAIGITERTDALVLVVSEETGEVSVVSHGQLSRSVSPLQLQDIFDQELKFRRAEAIPDSNITMDAELFYHVRPDNKNRSDSSREIVRMK